MSPTPLVSVIIPAYNAAAFIAETIESVLSQTYQNLEVLVVDDGSKDETPQIVQAFAQQDSRVILVQQANQGVAAARNLAIAKAKGELIAPIDADDIWYPEKLEKQVHCMMQSDPSVGLVYAWSAAINEKSTIIGSYYGFKSLHNVLGNAFLPLIYFNFLDNASAPLIRRTCFDQLGGYNVQLRAQNAQGCEDLDLYLRIAEHYQFAVVPEFLIGYRQSDGSMSTNLTAMEKSYRLVLGEAQQKIEIPKYLIQWSQGYFSLYLGLKAFMYRGYSQALQWIYQSVKLDPMICIHPLTLKLVLSCVVLIVFNDLFRLFGQDLQTYLKARRMKKRRRMRSLSEIIVESAQSDTFNLHYWLLLNRWVKIAKLQPIALSAIEPAPASLAEAELPQQQQA